MALQEVGSVLSANADVHVESGLAAYFPDLKYVVSDPRMSSAFDHYDERARRARRQYALAGVTSLVAAITALEFEAVSLAIQVGGHAVRLWAALLFPALALVSVAVIAWSRVADLRRDWLIHVFVRERLRQWRHQLLLDGPLMDLARRDPAAHEAAVNRRWTEFCSTVAIASGKFETFVGDLGTEQYWFVKPIMPEEAVITRQILELQGQLRVDMQLAFGEAKLAAGGRKAGISDLTRASDWLATTTLVSAIGVSAALFVSQATDSSRVVHAWLAATALGLGALSLGTRAIRAGLTIPYEQQSYREYIAQCQILAEAFRTASDDRTRWRVLEHLETNASAELRRYLRMKSESRFIA